MPKTIKNIYDNSVSFENLLKAHKKARCGKREKKKIILFELKLEQELLELEKKLKNVYFSISNTNHLISSILF